MDFELTGRVVPASLLQNAVAAADVQRYFQPLMARIGGVPQGQEMLALATAASIGARAGRRRPRPAP